MDRKELSRAIGRVEEVLENIASFLDTKAAALETIGFNALADDLKWAAEIISEEAAFLANADRTNIKHEVNEELAQTASILSALANRKTE